MAHFAEHDFASSRDSGLVAPHMSDPAFEPHSNFDFDNGDNDYRDLHQQITSLDMFPSGTGSQHDFAVRTGKSQDDETDAMKLYQFGLESLPTRDAWPAQHGAHALSPYSMQADIATKRSDSVDHQYGQLTPPDDALLSANIVSPQTSIQAQSVAKSERARNAANHRHGKTKKSRQDVSVDALSPQSDDAISLDDKRGKYREKNRLAAAKCRAKKKTNVEDLEVRARRATQRNTELKLEARNLRDVFSELRNQALIHDPSQGCSCGRIHQYNARMAQQAAHGASSMPAFLSHTMHGQSQFGNMMGPPLVDSERLSRTQSMSLPDHRQQMGLHPRSYSTVDQTTFLPEDLDMMQIDNNDLSDLSFEED